MNDKRVAGVVAVVVLAVVGYFFGGDAVNSFRNALETVDTTSETSVAPTTTSD